MSVAFRAAGTSSSGTGNLTPGLPAGTATNDILVLLVNTNAAGTISAPSGYTEALSSPVATSTSVENGANLGVFWKRAGASEAAPTVTDPSTADGAVASILGFSGCVTTGNPWHIANSISYSQESQTTSTTSYLIDTTTDYNAWTHTANVTGSGGAISHNTTTTDADGSGANGQIQHRITGRTVSCTNTSVLSITPTNLGVPAGAVVVGLSLIYAWRCSEYTTGASSSGYVTTSSPFGGAGVTSTGAFTATTSYADLTRTIARSGTTLYQDASSSITITLQSSLATGNSSTAAVSLLFDNIRVTIDYITVRSPFSYPTLTTTQTNTMVLMAAGNAFNNSKSVSDFSSPVNGNLTSLTERLNYADGTFQIYGGLWAATGFSATAQSLGESTVASNREQNPVSLWTGALLGTDSVGNLYSGWGIPIN